MGSVRFGSLRRLTPISRAFGYDRGLPIDRYYIESFLASHADDVRGRVLEVGDDSYTRRFGGDRVTEADVLHIDATNPRATFVGDLAEGAGLPDDAFDCIVLTQTLQLVEDLPGRRGHPPPGAAPRAAPCWPPCPGISQVSADEWAENWLWSMTPRAAQRLFAAEFGAEAVEVAAYGNVLAATGFLQGLAAEELRPHELDYHDPQYADAGGRAGGQGRRRTVTTAVHGWVENRPSRGRGLRAIDLSELWSYRELVRALAVRDLKVRYKQAAFGIAWAVIQPLLGAAVFTLVFARLADVDVGYVPYPLFAFVGFAAWTYHSQAVSTGTESLVQNQAMVTKIYYPKVASPAGQRPGPARRPGHLAAGAGRAAGGLRGAARPPGGGAAPGAGCAGGRLAVLLDLAVGPQRPLPRRALHGHVRDAAVAVHQPGRLPEPAGLGRRGAGSTPSTRWSGC